LEGRPIIERGCFVLLGNDGYLLRQLAAGDPTRARDYAAWLLGVTRGYAIKIVNPGGIARWKSGGGAGGSADRNVSGIDDPVGSSSVTPRKILEVLAGAANPLGRPHPVHVHCNPLGQPGRVRTHHQST